MATTAQAWMHLLLQIEGLPSPIGGALRETIENANGGRRWTDGQGSGEVDRLYVRFRDARTDGDGLLGAGATDSYDLLAAGGLLDIHGQAIDADELKAIIVIPTSGSIKIDAPAANFLPIFVDANGAIDLAGVQAWAMDFGAAGIDVSVDSKFDIVETTTSTTAGYVLALIVAQ